LHVRWFIGAAPFEGGDVIDAVAWTCARFEPGRRTRVPLLELSARRAARAAPVFSRRNGIGFSMASGLITGFGSSLGGSALAESRTLPMLMIVSNVARFPGAVA
jgi:hypothetical protein